MNSKRIQKEITQLRRELPPFVKDFAIINDNLYELVFLIEKILDTPFSEGQYVLKVSLPKEYPFRAPKIFFLTPNGRFQINESICIAGLSQHHKEDWSAQQNIASLLISVISFMNEESNNHIGSFQTNIETKQKFASASFLYNKEHKLLDLFGDIGSDDKN